MNNITSEDFINIVIVGHVDHGKSTVIGRLLADTNALPEGKLDQIREKCRRNSKPFEYAFLLDALKEEQEQGITIDSARCFFKYNKRKYIIIDAPGHKEFLKNMITGAARADAALLVIDAKEGIQENSKKHAHLLSFLGINQVCVLINKMDLVDYSEDAYKSLCAEFAVYLKKLNLNPMAFIPVSGFLGDNLFEKSENMKWHKAETLIDILEKFSPSRLPYDKPLRMPVQSVYKFTKDGDSRRIVAGTIETGSFKTGDEIIFYPSGKKSIIKTIESFNTEPKTSATAGDATGFTLQDQLYIKRGEIAALKNNSPKVGTRIKTSIFWLGRENLIPRKTYTMKLCTAREDFVIEKILSIFDSSKLEEISRDVIERNDVAECIIKLDNPIAFDEIHSISETARFVIVDDYEISGGGILLEGLKDERQDILDNVVIRNINWELSDISQDERYDIYNQKSSLILVTGAAESARKQIAKSLEKKLFSEGKKAYYLAFGSILYGVDADIKKEINRSSEEHFRRLGEIANIMLDSGMILIVTAVNLTQEDMEIIHTAVNPEKIISVWAGDIITTDIKHTMKIPDSEKVDSAVNKIKSLLQEKNIIFKP